MSIIKSFEEVKDENVETLSKLCHSSSEPVFIVKNGCEDMVVMSTEVYIGLVNLKEDIEFIERFEKRLANKETDYCTLEEATAEIRRNR